MVKVAHSLIWAFFAFCVLVVAAAGLRARWDFFLYANAMVSVEILVLALNHGRCPLTDLAAKFTSDRRENFDIYLPLWFAKNNKRIFGTILVLGEAFGLARWLG